MCAHSIYLRCVAVWLLLAPALWAADAPNTAETRMRESLRNTMLQLRTAQGERDALAAEKAETAQRVLDLTAKLDALNKQSATDKAAAEKGNAAISARLGEQERENAGLKVELDMSKRATLKAAEWAKVKESERVKLATQVIELQRRVAERETQNAALFRTGIEILERYESFGLGTALTAKEPFIGITRVRLQNLVQDYSDKLLEQKVKH